MKIESKSVVVVVVVDQKHIDEMNQVEGPLQMKNLIQRYPTTKKTNSRKGSSSKHLSGIEGLLINIEKHLDRR